MCVQKNKRNLDRGRISDSSAATQTALRKIPFFFSPSFSLFIGSAIQFRSSCADQSGSRIYVADEGRSVEHGDI